MPILNIAVTVTDEEFGFFLNKLAASASGVSATDEDGDELLTGTTGDTDINGVPWLEAVHSGSKAQTKDKRWKRQKGVTEDVRDAAEKAWLAAHTQPLSAAPVAVPGMPVTVPVIAPAPIVTPVTTAPVSGGVFIPGMAPAPTVPVVVADVPVTLEDVSNAFAKLTAKGVEFNDAVLNHFYTTAGIADPQSIATNETARKDLVKVINDTLAQMP